MLIFGQRGKNICSVLCKVRCKFVLTSDREVLKKKYTSNLKPLVLLVELSSLPCYCNSSYGSIIFYLSVKKRGEVTKVFKIWQSTVLYNFSEKQWSLQY